LVETGAVHELRPRIAPGSGTSARRRV